MSENTNQQAGLQQRLQDYVFSRLGSQAVARRAAAETVQRMSHCDVVKSVGSPEIYMQGFALSVALRMREYHQEEGTPW